MQLLRVVDLLTSVTGNPQSLVRARTSIDILVAYLSYLTRMKIYVLVIQKLLLMYEIDGKGEM